MKNESFVKESFFAVLLNTLRKELRTYIIDNKIKALVCGVSGGLDSGLICAIAYPVCVALDIPLLGYSLPIGSNSAQTRDNAKLVGDAFCTRFEEKDLYELFLTTAQHTTNIDPNTKKIDEKIRLGNIKARLRMIFLYDKAQEHEGLVLSTDNYTEYLLGFSTLHGDVGDFGLIQYLWKTECYGLAAFLIKTYTDNKKIKALKSTVEAIPTDELGITDSDFDQLGASSYKEIDGILKDFLDYTNSDMKKHEVIKRHLRTHFKRQNPINIERDLIISNITAHLDTIQKLFNLQDRLIESELIAEKEELTPKELADVNGAFSFIQKTIKDIKSEKTDSDLSIDETEIKSTVDENRDSLDIMQEDAYKSFCADTDFERYFDEDEYIDECIDEDSD